MQNMMCMHAGVTCCSIENLRTVRGLTAELCPCARNQQVLEVSTAPGIVYKGRDGDETDVAFCFPLLTCVFQYNTTNLMRLTALVQDQSNTCCSSSSCARGLLVGVLLYLCTCTGIAPRFAIYAIKLRLLMMATSVLHLSCWSCCYS